MSRTDHRDDSASPDRRPRRSTPDARCIRGPDAPLHDIELLEFAEEQLEAFRAYHVRRHVSDCAHCRRLVDLHRTLLGAVRRDNAFLLTLGPPPSQSTSPDAMGAEPVNTQSRPGTVSATPLKPPPPLFKRIASITRWGRTVDDPVPDSECDGDVE